MFTAIQWSCMAALWTAGLEIVLKLYGIAIGGVTFLVAAATLAGATLLVALAFHRIIGTRYLSPRGLMRIGERVYRRNRERLRREALDRYVAIDPATRCLVIARNQEDAIARGRESFGHLRFYVRPVDDERIPRIRAWA